ncbi:MAG: amidohydrolase [Candidatus Eremiobacteraeota bacterium]|nr:amidohydrolase [Candidatus Eremiobacteraeota bacterium]
MSTAAVVKNARFVGQEHQGCDAMLIEGGKIRALAKTSDIDALSGGTCEVIDMAGAFIVPGFIDTHTHFLHTGLHMTMVSLVAAKSIDEMITILREEEGETAEWKKGFGFDESLFSEGRRPTRHDLDKAEATRPLVIFRRDYHSCVVNTAALKSLSLPEAIASHAVSEGIFAGKANDWIRQVLSKSTGDRERREACMKAAALALSRGVTTVHALEGGSLFTTEDLEFFIEGGLPLGPRVVLYPQITDIRWVKERGLPRIGGCLLVDGSFGSWTAALSEPYQDRADTAGILYFDDGALFSFVERAHSEGLQISLHAIGDRAIRQAVDAYERALARHPAADHRHRIEHCELPSVSDIERIAKLGIALGVQPAFESLWGGEGKMYHRRLGLRRMRRTNPLRELQEAGIVMGGGSDSDVTPLDPFLGIEAAATHPTKPSRLTVSEGLELYTGNAAFLSRGEGSPGRLAEGMAADFTVLSMNPLQTPGGELGRIRILKTFVGGECLFEGADTPGAKNIR